MREYEFYIIILLQLKGRIYHPNSHQLRDAAEGKGKKVKKYKMCNGLEWEDYDTRRYPGRGGSKGIPNKNIKELCGKPLIAWTVEAARQSKLLDRYIVSTEDERLAEISREYGTSGLRKQDIKGFFNDDGNVYVIKTDLIRQGDRYGKKIERVITDREQNIEIDDEFDFWVAEQVLKRRGAK